MRGGQTLLALLVLAGACAEPPALRDEAWRCAGDEDCLWGRVCVAGSCQPPGTSPTTDTAGGDVLSPPDAGPDIATCNVEAACVPGTGQTEDCGSCGGRLRVCGDDCTWGDWGPCRNAGECAADAHDSEPCGRCGRRTRVCDEACEWSPWSACGEEGVCAPEAVEDQPCGNCGRSSRTCREDCRWSAWSLCADEGSCSAETEQTEVCGRCGTRTRACDTACAWGDWSPCAGEGACDRGDMAQEPCGRCGTRAIVCDDTCQWQPGACTNQGACLPEQLGERPCGLCGVETRVCADDCTWRDYGPCEREGPCAPNAIADEPCPDCGWRSRVCGDDCRWLAWTRCAGEPSCLAEESCTTSGVCPGTMVLVPGGPFWMGSADGDGHDEEQPRHEVILAAFEIDRHEVTANDFAAFLQAAGNEDTEGNFYLDLADADAPIARTDGVYLPRAICRDGPGDDPPAESCADHPVHEVTWYGARAYCAWRGKRLPSEAEWERAAAGAAAGRYPWGDASPGPTLASCGEEACADGYPHTAPVGSFPAGDSESGCRDMAGNVWEWVQDMYHPGYAGAPTDGSAWETPASSWRVARGGGWRGDADALRAARRAPHPPSTTPNDAIGFRCAR